MKENFMIVWKNGHNSLQITTNGIIPVAVILLSPKSLDRGLLVPHLLAWSKSDRLDLQIKG